MQETHEDWLLEPVIIVVFCAGQEVHSEDPVVPEVFLSFEFDFLGVWVGRVKVFEFTSKT